MTCNGCNAKPGRAVDVFRRDIIQASGYLCDDCFDTATDKLNELRKVFDYLLSTGMSRKLANKLMIRCIDDGQT